MKRFTLLSAIVIAATFLTNFSIKSSVKLKLYPEIEKYYASLPNTPTSDQYHDTFRDLSAYIRMGSESDSKADLLFTCSDNSVRSVTAQIVLQSLLSVNRYNKIVVNSCGTQPTEINPVFITVLTKHGFQVKELPVSANGKKSYSVAFGDNMTPVTIYAKSSDDVTVPKSGFFQVAMCDNGCPDLPTAKYKGRLSYSTLGNNTTEEETEKTFTAIATDISYAFNKATK
jgi:Low molecular weight phosphotyrosine protein phosphatase